MNELGKSVGKFASQLNTFDLLDIGHWLLLHNIDTTFTISDEQNSGDAHETMSAARG